MVIEGYGPPDDPRLQSMTVTPDPGVIEVNVQPTASFAEQVGQLDTLYEQARQARLATESFDVDGTPRRHRRRQPHHPGRHRRPPNRRCCAGPTCWCRC